MTNQHIPEEISVLGKTFKTEEERRKFFSNELRKMLPELRKMDGFPIGEDEDIINLSDPPFYTACPNPWLNEFIVKWEIEKNKLKNTARDPDFEVKEPYSANVKEGKTDPIYTAHSYHTKVPHKAIMRYLIYYTQPGDIIYDGFAGSGMTGVAATKCGDKKEIENLGFLVDKSKIYNNGKVIGTLGVRKAILNDISPAATNLAYNNTNALDIFKFEEQAITLIKKAKEKFEWMYLTHDPVLNKMAQVEYFVWSEISTCTDCGGDLRFSEIAFENDLRKIKKNICCPTCGAKVNKRNLRPQYETRMDDVLEKVIQIPKRELVLICFKRKNKKIFKKPDEKDFSLFNKILKEKTPEIPTAELPDMQMMRVGRMKQVKISHTHQFFFKRTQLVLHYLWNESNKIKDKKEKEILRYWLDSHFVNLSYRNRHRPNVSFPYNPMTGVFYVPMMSSEANPFVAYENKIKRIKLAFKDSSTVKNKVLNSTNSVTNSGLDDNSIDYIFTDPPFGENIYYSDLNYFIEVWNKVFTNTKPEAIVDKVKSKSLFVYNELIFKCFQEYYRILKPGRWMTVVFSNTQAAVWNGIRMGLTNAGFVIANISDLDKEQGSFMAVNTTTAVKHDLVISCYKPSSEFSRRFSDTSQTEIGVWQFLEEHLNHLPKHLSVNNKTSFIAERSPKILFDSLIKYYFQKNLAIPIDALKFQLGLKEKFSERDGMFFTHEEVQEYDKRKALIPEVDQLSFLVSTEQEGIIWLKNLLRNNNQTYQEINSKWIPAIVGVRNEDILPELNTILVENFLQDDNERWYVPNPENEADLEKVRNKRLLRIFEGYKTENSKPKGKIKEARVEALRAGFKQAYQDKDFKTIVQVGDRIPNQLLMEDEVLLQFYDIAVSRV